MSGESLFNILSTAPRGYVGGIGVETVTAQQSILINLDRGSFDRFASEAEGLRYG
jgi:hypothetical protein